VTTRVRVEPQLFSYGVQLSVTDEYLERQPNTRVILFILCVMFSNRVLTNLAK